MPFAVVKGYTDKNGVNGYPLCTYSSQNLEPGNIIKLGRVEFMVIEMRNDDETLTLRDTHHFEETTGTFDATKPINHMLILG